jgi:hypothetical protein
MERNCAAVANSTDARCHKSRMPGSRYCLYHFEKGPILLAALIGAILSLAVADSYHFVVPSAESRQLVAAGKETAGLRKEISRLQSQVDQQQKTSAEREQLHLAQVSELNSRLGPFIRAATVKYPGVAVDQALARLEKNIAGVSARAAVLELKATPRSLTVQQRASFSAALATEPIGAVVIKSSVSAPDARGYAEEIAGVLRKVGWRVKIDNALFGGTDISGLWITVKNSNNVPAAAGSLQRALHQAGIQARGKYDPGLDGTESDVWLSVGIK